MNRKTKFLATALCLCFIGGAAIGCNDAGTPGGPPVDDDGWTGNWTRPDVPDDVTPDIHNCDHSCYECGKCLTDCDDEKCTEKCYDEHDRTKYVFNGTDDKVVKRGGITINKTDGYLGNINANPSAEIVYYIKVDAEETETVTVCMGATVSEGPSESSITAKTPIYINDEQFFSRGYLKGGPTQWTMFYTAWLGCVQLRGGVNEIRITGKGDAYNIKDLSFVSDTELTLVPEGGVSECTHMNAAGKCTDYESNERVCMDKDETGWSKLEIAPGDAKVLKYGVNSKGDEISLWVSNENVIGQLANGSITGIKDQTVVFAFESSEETYVGIALETGTQMTAGSAFKDVWNFEFNGETVKTGAVAKITDNPGWNNFLENKVIYVKARKGYNSFVMKHNNDTNAGDNINNIILTAQSGTLTTAQAYKPDASVDVTGVTLAAAGGATSVHKGATLQLTASVEPAIAANKNVTFSTSDADIATVDENGLVTAVDYGEVTITVTTEDGGFTDSITLTVTVAVESVTLTAPNGTTQIKEGETLQLNAAVLPDNASDRSVTYSSSNRLVATVDENGLVTAIGAGTVTITVTTTDGGKTDTFELTVAELDNRVPTTGVTITAAGGATSVKKGQKLQLNATVAPDNATNKNVTYSTSDDTVATVDENGLVTALEGGEVTLTVTTVEGNFTASITLTVTVDVESVKLTVPSTSLRVDDTLVLSTTVLPANATDKSVTYKVTKDGVEAEGYVTVDGGTALFAPDSVGTYVITAISASAPDKQSSVEIVVYGPVTGEDHFFEGEDAAMTAGSMGNISVKTDDEGAKNKTSLQNINLNNGATLTYVVNAGSACEAGLYLSLAFGMDEVPNNIFIIEVNGKKVTVVPDSFKQTGAVWSTFNEHWFANVSLKSGLNTIKLTVNGVCGNYDYMTLKSATSITAAQNVVTGIDVKASKALLKPAETLALTVNVSGTSQAVTYSSSDTAVATVDENGVVTAVGDGVAVITVTGADELAVKNSVRIFVRAGEGTAYEAEDAALTNATIEPNGNYVGGMNNPGAKVTFTVNATASGKALLVIKTSVVHTDKLTIDKYFDVKIGGELADLSDGVFIYKGGANWNTDSGEFVVEIELEAGENTIELIAVSTDVATTLDKIIIYE